MTLQCLVPADKDISEVLSFNDATLLPFSSMVIDFIDNFSTALLTDYSLRRHPELVALGFWMRTNSIRKFEEEFRSRNELKIKLARGTVFHIAPSNVDTIFIYSLLLSLLMGNRNIVRVSNRASVQRDLLNGILNTLLAKNNFAKLRDYLCVVSYEHDVKVTGELSQLCDVRVVWGGDTTIAAVCQVPIPARSTEVRFANKYSFALLDSNEVAGLDQGTLELLAKNFVNDAYSFAQMACSSPRSVIWLGRNEGGIEAFWRAVEQRLEHFDHQFQSGDYVNKLVAGYSMAIERPCGLERNDSNLLLRVKCESLENLYDELHCGSGLFVESYIESLEQLSPMLSRKIQSLSYFGLTKETLFQWAARGLKGVDRIVPIGQALDFDKVWDGYDLTEYLTREITVL